MKVLVTGGAGYIGTALVYELIKDQSIEKIIIYDNLIRSNHNLFIGVHKLAKDRVIFVEGDLLDSRKLRKLLVEVDVVYHLAAKVTTPFADEDPHTFEQTNNWGTAELTYAIEASEIQKFIYTSSVSVYGASAKEVDVDNDLNPRSFYGISKMRGEGHVRRLMGKVPTYIFRAGNVYGYSKSMRFESVINKLLFEANFKNRISINGDGNQHRSFIHINKLVRTLYAPLRDQLNPGIYDTVEHVLSINEIVQLLRQIYPQLESINVNQHLRLRELKVKPNEVVNKLFDDLKRPLKQELIEFSEAFSY